MGTVVFLTACAGSDEGGLAYPIAPPGHQQEGTPTTDLSPTILGRVCVLADARAPTTCSTSGADGLTVELAGQMATTDATGAFSIMRPPNGDAMWQVSGTAIKSSALKYTARGTTIPAVSASVYDAMLTDSNAIEVAGKGGLIAQLKSGTAPAMGKFVVASPTPDSELYYDSTTATTWDLDATGSAGMIWIPAIQVTTMGALFVDDMATTMDFTILADHVTFMFETVP